MGFDSWGVMPDLEGDKFVLAFQDSSPAQGQPFMKMLDPMTEDDARATLKELGKTYAEIDAAIAKAKEQWEKNNQMTVNTFLAAHHNVHVAKHGDNFAYLGLDQADRWWMHWAGDGELLGEMPCEEAQTAAEKKIGGTKLNWEVAIGSGYTGTPNTRT